MNNTASRFSRFLASALTHFRTIALMHFLFLPLVSPADTFGPYTHTVSAGKSTITYFKRTYSGSLSITNSLGGYPVTSIGDRAFHSCTSLTSVTIPGNITSIGNLAFRDCTSLTSVTIPDSVTAIGYGAFNGCDSLTSVTIPGSVKRIEGGTFSGCSNMTNIIIPANIKIDDDAFNGCTNLPTATLARLKQKGPVNQNLIRSRPRKTASTPPLPTLTEGPYTYTVTSDKATITGFDTSYCGTWSITNSLGGYPVTTVGDHAFYGCSLTSITVPASVTSIDSSAFSVCTLVTAINVDPDNPAYAGFDGVLFNKNLTTLIKCPRAFSGHYTIPDNVTSISNAAFSDCRSLNSATIGNSVTNIGGSAFFGCSSLTSVTIPNSVTSIGNGAFSGCDSLTAINVAPANPAYASIDGVLFNKDHTTLIQCPVGFSGPYTIPNSVTSIGNGAFSGCDSLTAITVPASVKTILRNAFLGCNSLTAINVAPLNPRYASINGVLFDKNLTTLIKYPRSFSGPYTIPDSVTTIGSWSFSSCDSLTSVTISNSVTYIGDYAFSSCSSLTSVSIPTRVTHIGNGAFSGCASLTSITIPDRVTHIGMRAFYGCASLTSITIPDSVSRIGEHAFSGCSNMTNIIIPANIKIGGNAFSGCTNLPPATLELIKTKQEPLRGLGGSAPLRSAPTQNLTSLKRTFVNYTYTVTNGQATITGFNTSYSGALSITNELGGYPVTAIGQCAFQLRRSLASVTIPDSVTSIGDYAFNYCISLTSVTIPDSVTSIGDWAFRNCTALTSVTIPDSVTSIGGHAFHGCSSLASVTIGNSVNSIGGYAFYKCSSLTSITFGNNVTSIGDYAFEDCDSLTSVTIPDSVSRIGSYTFSGCSNMTNIIIPANIKIGGNAFSGCTNLPPATLELIKTKTDNSRQMRRRLTPPQISTATKSNFT